MANDISSLEAAAEAKYGLPAGVMSSIRKQETGNNSAYIEDPTKYHYPLNSEGKRIAGHTGKTSTAFGPYGILESTAAQPGYGVTPLASKDLDAQVEFAASYLAGRSKSAGSLKGGLAGYGEGSSYADKILNRIGGNNTMATTPTASVPESISSGAAGNIARNDAAAAAMESLFGQMQDTLTESNKILAQQKLDTILVKSTEGMAQANANSAALGFARELGTDPSVSDNALMELAQESKVLYARKRQITASMENALNPLNIFKDPLSYLGDVVMFDFNEARNRNVDNALQVNHGQSKFLNEATQEAKQTALAIAQPVTVESAQANARVAAAVIDNAMQQNSLEALKMNADGISRIRALQNNSLDISLKLRDQEIQEQQVIAAKASAEASLANSQLLNAERQIRLDDREEARKGREQTLAAVNLGRKATGLPEFGSTTELENFVKLNPDKVSETVGQQYKIGMVVAQTGATAAPIGDTPFETLSYMAQSGAKITDGRAKVIEFLGKVRNNLEAQAADPKNAKLAAALKTKNGMQDAFNAAAINQANTSLNNVMAGGSNNPYAPPPAEVFVNDPTFGSSYIAQEFIKPLMEGGQVALNPKQIMAMGLDAVSKGKISQQQFESEFRFMGEKIKGYNNNLYRYNEVAGLPNMKSVKVPLDNTSSRQSFFNQIDDQAGTSPVSNLMQTFLGGSDETIVDISDPVSLSAYISKRRALSIPPVLREQAGVSNRARSVNVTPAPVPSQTTRAAPAPSPAVRSNSPSAAPSPSNTFPGNRLPGNSGFSSS